MALFSWAARRWLLARLPENYQIHTTPCRSTPSTLIAVLSIQYVGKVVAAFAGRRMRTWWRCQTKQRKQVLTERYRKSAIVTVSSVPVLLSLYYYTHLSPNPFKEKRQFLIFSPTQIKDIADWVTAMKLRSQRGELLAPNHPIQKRVEGITRRILDANRFWIGEPANNAWSVYVVDSSVQNAMALPNGKIFLYTGILSLFRSDDELGGILAHEISHALLLHGAEQLCFSHLTDVAMLPGIFAIWAIFRRFWMALFFHALFSLFIKLAFILPESRALEEEADKMGLLLAARACLDVRAISAFWSKMWVIQELTGSHATVERISTHPAHLSRAKAMNELVPDALALRTQAYCPPLAATDPREEIEKIKKFLLLPSTKKT